MELKDKELLLDYLFDYFNSIGSDLATECNQQFSILINSSP